MTFKVQRTGSAEYGRFIKMLIVGFPGSGKTLTSSTWKNPVFAACEPGLMSVADRDMPFVDVSKSENLFTLKQVLDQDAETREELFGFPVDTVILDTIDEIQKVLIRERLDANRKEAMELRDWGWLGEQMQAIIRGFRNLDLNVVLTCHMKEGQDSDTGRVYWTPGLQGAIGDQIAGFVDLSLWLRAEPHVEVVGDQTVRSIKRVLQTYPDAGHSWIKDRSGKLPPEVEINFTDDYDRLYELIYGGPALKDSESDVVKVPIEDTQETAELQAEEVKKSRPVKKPVEKKTAKKKAEPAPEPTPPEIPEGQELLTTDAPPEGFLHTDDCPKGQQFCAIDDNQRDLSKIRFRRVLCRDCFVQQSR